MVFPESPVGVEHHDDEQVGSEPWRLFEAPEAGKLSPAPPATISLDCYRVVIVQATYKGRLS